MENELRLIRPALTYHHELVHMVQEFTQAGDWPYGSALTPAEEAKPDGPTVWRAERLAQREYAEGFLAYLHSRDDEALAAQRGLVPSTDLWIVRDRTLLGFVSLRHCLNDYLLNAGGHIGYSVRPAARRQGVATWALGQTLRLASTELGLSRVLVTCDDTNHASATVIERNAGLLEDTRDHKRRYWITLGG